MDPNPKMSVTTLYKDQLKQIDVALLTAEGDERDELLALKMNIEELLTLTEENAATNKGTSSACMASSSNHLDDEYTQFMAELAMEGAVDSGADATQSKADVSEELKSLEGMKCKAPHRHHWGDMVYHNAMICAVLSQKPENYNDIQVKVFFMNPTHEEMLPCPYYLEGDCKFTEEKCRYSHGEVVAFSDLEEYVEPKFELLCSGSSVLAKQANNLWYRALVRRVYDGKCLVKFESKQKSEEILFEHLLPLESSATSDNDYESGNESSSNETPTTEDVINMSLTNEPTSSALGDWEKHTKGIGSKLMEKMGYVVGTGLGRNSDGRLDPVTAVILPAGKSLDHCMQLRENAGGDKNLFSAEKKLKRLQRRQEIRSQKVYEKEKKKVDVFNFLNQTLLPSANPNESVFNPTKYRQDIQKDTARELNVASLKTDEDIRKTERELWKITESLTRHSDIKSPINKNLQQQLASKQKELKFLQSKALNIKNEQNLRNDKKKMTVF